MSRILRRPMFKMGGSTNSGIMTGLVDRKGYTGIKQALLVNQQENIYQNLHRYYKNLHLKHDYHLVQLALP